MRLIPSQVKKNAPLCAVFTAAAALAYAGMSGSDIILKEIFPQHNSTTIVAARNIAARPALDAPQASAPAPR